MFQIPGSICISFPASHTVLCTKLWKSSANPALPTCVVLMHTQGQSVGRWSCVHLPRFGNTVIQAASQSCCLTASQAPCTKTKQSSPRKTALDFECFGDCFAVVAIRKLPSQLIDVVWGVYTEVWQLCNDCLFASNYRLHVSIFLMQWLNVELREEGKIGLFSGTKYWDSRDFSRCLSFGTKSYFCLFVFFECATFPETMFLLCSICAVFNGLWSIMKNSTDTAIIISVLLWNSTGLIILVLVFASYFIKHFLRLFQRRYIL